jgi:hypothetical protein
MNVAQADLELLILLPQPPECWNYRRELPCLAEILNNVWAWAPLVHFAQVPTNHVASPALCPADSG